MGKIKNAEKWKILLELLKSAIWNLLISALSNILSITDDERLLLSGMSIVWTTMDADKELEFFKKATSVLTNTIIDRKLVFLKA